MNLSKELLNNLVDITSNSAIACYPYVGKNEKILAAATILEKADLTDLVHIDVRAPKNPVLCRSSECSYAS